MKAGSLTPKQKRFVHEYMVDLNATKAAIRSGYSKKTARSVGAENLTKPDIADTVAEAERSILEKIKMDSEETLRETAHIARSRAGALFDENGNLRPIHELDDATQAAIASVKVVTKPGKALPDGSREVEYLHEIKFWDKNKALDRLHAHHALAAPERHEHLHKHEFDQMSDVELRAALVAEIGEEAVVKLGIKIGAGGSEGV